MPMLLFLGTILSVKIWGRIKQDKKDYLVVDNEGNGVCKQVKIICCPHKNFKHEVTTHATPEMKDKSNYTFVEVPKDVRDQYIKVEIVDNHNKVYKSKAVNYGDMKSQSPDRFFKDAVVEEGKSHSGKSSGYDYGKKSSSWDMGSDDYVVVDNKSSGKNGSTNAVPWYLDTKNNEYIPGLDGTGNGSSSSGKTKGENGSSKSGGNEKGSSKSGGKKGDEEESDEEDGEGSSKDSDKDEKDNGIASMSIGILLIFGILTFF